MARDGVEGLLLLRSRGGRRILSDVGRGPWEEEEELPTVADPTAFEGLSALREELDRAAVRPAEDRLEEEPIPEEVRARAATPPPTRPTGDEDITVPTSVVSPRSSLPPPLDLPAALGVEPPAPNRAHPRDREPALDAALEADLAALLEPQTPPPSRALRPEKPPRPEKTPRPGRTPRPRPKLQRPREASSIRRLAQSSQALSRSLPIVLGTILLACLAIAFVKLIGGQRSTPHVRLEVLALPGQPLPTPREGAGSRIILDSDPQGVVVFHGQRILGKTPCEAELPMTLPERVGFRLHGPRFEEWVGEVDASPAGEFLIHASLTER